jgi:hypothetical protein
MSKGISGDGINVKMELWKRAHEIEAKAMEAGDIQAMNEAAEWKGKLTLGLFTEHENAPEQDGFTPGNGIQDSLSGMKKTMGDIGIESGETK